MNGFAGYVYVHAMIGNMYLMGPEVSYLSIVYVIGKTLHLHYTEYTYNSYTVGYAWMPITHKAQHSY